MKFIPSSRRTGCSSIPENEAPRNLEEMGKWVELPEATVPMPIRVGKTKWIQTASIPCGQITLIGVTRAVTDSDRAAARRAFDAMMPVKKIDIAAIAAAHGGS